MDREKALKIVDNLIENDWSNKKVLLKHDNMFETLHKYKNIMNKAQKYLKENLK